MPHNSGKNEFLAQIFRPVWEKCLELGNPWSKFGCVFGQDAVSKANSPLARDREKTSNDAVHPRPARVNRIIRDLRLFPLLRAGLQ